MLNCLLLNHCLHIGHWTGCCLSEFLADVAAVIFLSLDGDGGVTLCVSEDFWDVEVTILAD